MTTPTVARPRLWRRSPPHWVDILAAIALVVVATMLYAPRLLPGTGFTADTSKYHYIGAVLGISHPPGSPLYMLIDWFVAQLPIGELAWRINALSACAGAAASVFLYLLSLEVSRSRIAALGAALGLLTASTFWEQSEIAEVYTVHAAFLLAGLWMLARWYRIGHISQLAIGAVIYGLSFGVHVMSWYGLPAWIGLTLFGPRSISANPRALAVVAVGAVSGMSTYLYFVVRPAMHPIYSEATIDSLATFLDYVTGSYFRHSMFVYDASTMLHVRLPWLGTLAWLNLGVPMLVLASIGIWAAFRQELRVGLAMATPILLSAAYAMGYAVPDARVFALPALYFLLVASALGLSVIVELSTRWAGSRAAAPIVLVVLLLTMAERAPQFARNGVLLDRSGETGLDRQSAQMIDVVQNRSTIVAGSDIAFHTLAYQLWGRRVSGRVGVRLMPHADQGCDEVRRSVDGYLERGPVYATTELANCFPGSSYALDVRDLSETLPDFLAAIRPGQLLLVALPGPGFDDVSPSSWAGFRDLGLMDGISSGDGSGYAAVLVRNRDGFMGMHNVSSGEALITLARGSSLTTSQVLPFDVSLRSGNERVGGVASIIVSGVEYAQPRRGIQVAVFDAATGTPVTREVFGTDAALSASYFYFFRILRRLPPR